MEWRRLTQPEEPAFGRAMALYEASLYEWFHWWCY